MGKQTREVLFSLMGSQPGPVFYATQLLSWTDLHILYSDKYYEEAVKAKGDLERMYKNTSIELVPIDAFDLRKGIFSIVDAAVRKIKKLKEEGKQAHILINITGGTDVMTSAALLAGIMLEADLYYIKSKRNEETGEYEDPEVIDINPPRVLAEDIDEKKYKILETIENYSATTGRKITTGELAKQSGFNSSAAINRHLALLEEKGIIFSEREGKFRYHALTDNGKIFLKLRSVFGETFSSR